MFSSTYKFPFQSNHQYTAEVRHKPSIPNNLRKWQIFENDQQINNFLTLDNEFVNTNIDTDIAVDFNRSDEVEINKIENDQIDRFHPIKFIKADIQNIT